MKLLLSILILISGQQVLAQSQRSLPECTQEFVSDFTAVTTALDKVVAAIDTAAPAQEYRGTLVSGLNSCHTLVEKHVQIDPKNGNWNGQACTRVVEQNTQMLDPKFHRAECEYLQRLLDRED